MGNYPYFAQIVTNGLHNGGLYALLAYGYVLTYTVTRRANIAHGAVFAFSGQILVLAATFGYTTLWMTLFAAIAFGTGIAMVLCLLLLLLFGRIVFPPLVQRAPNTMIAATLAISIVLMESVRIGADARDYWLPPLLSSQVFLPVSDPAPSLSFLQLINLLIMATSIAVAEFVLQRTSAGRTLRAVADDPFASNLLAINVKRVITLAILVGGAFACLAGILAVLYFGNMSFGSGLVFGLKLLFITAAGGFNSPLRAAFAAFLFGEAEALWDGYLPIMWREPVFYATLAFILCTRTENRLERI